MAEQFLTDEQLTAMRSWTLADLIADHAGFTKLVDSARDRNRLQGIADAAEIYVTIKSDHPQVAGEAYRDLLKALGRGPEREP